MFKEQRVPLFLLMAALVVRPHMAGGAYPFSQGLILIPVLVGLALLLLNPSGKEGASKCQVMVWVLPWTLWAWSLTAIVWAPDPGQGVRESVTLLGSVTVFNVVCLLMNREKGFGTAAIPVLGLIMIPVLASALYQRMFGLDRIREKLSQMEASGDHVAELARIIADDRVFAGFLNPNMLAGFLAIGICVTLDLLLTASDRRRVLFFASLTGAQCAVLVLTGSVGGSMVAVITAGAVVYLRRKLSLRETLIAALVILLLAAGLLAGRGGSFLFGPESSLGQRGGYMAAGIRMALVHPVLGWGSGASPGALMGYVAGGVRPVTDPHNFLIRIWISWGLPGLVILGCFLYFWLRLVVRPFTVRDRQGVPAGYAGLVLGSAAFLGHSLLDMDFFVPEAAFFGWCALGAAAGLAAAQEGTGAQTARVSAGNLKLAAGAAVLLLVLPTFVYLQGESLAFRAGRDMAEKEYESAAGLLRAARGLLPMNGRFALDEGRARFASGDVASSLELFAAAESLMRASPYPSWEMGRAAQRLGQWQRSIPPLEKALSRYSTSPRIRIDLARAYLNLGDTGKVRSLLVEARQLAVFDAPARETADRILSRMDR